MWLSTIPGMTVMPVATPDTLRMNPTSAMMFSGELDIVACAGVFVMSQVYDRLLKRRTPAISDERSV
jgi:hypothetical protein